MRRVGEVRLPFDHDAQALARAVARLGCEGAFCILKKSLDARDKRRIVWVYAIGLPEPADEAVHSPRARREPDPRPLIIGCGPGGLFAAYWLALHGVRAVVLEQGAPLRERLRSVARFLRKGELDLHSNICFGAGGAGAYSDGKLMTRIHSPHLPLVMETFVRFGAPEEVRYLYNPHLGSNGIRRVIDRLISFLVETGVELRWNARVVSLDIRGGVVQGALLASGELVPASHVLLAIGHSSRPLYEELVRLAVPVAFKPFAVGARLEHPAELVNRLQHGPHAGHPALGAASYRLAETWAEGDTERRALYSFCMCPGGYVLNAATELDGVVTNGMSNRAKRGRYSNAAIVVNVEERDLPGDELLRGMLWQRELERRAARVANGPGGGCHALPGQRLLEFLAGQPPTSLPQSSALTPVRPSPLHEILPQFVVEAMRRGLAAFNRKMRGLIGPEALLVGVETRTSSPLRILRDPVTRESLGVRGLFPVGEGAGYAGGIVSAAADGLASAEVVLQALPLQASGGA